MTMRCFLLTFVGSVAERVKGAIFTVAMILVQVLPSSHRIVASLDKALYDDYYLLVGFEQAGNYVKKSNNNQPENSKVDNC